MDIADSSGIFSRSSRSTNKYCKLDARLDWAIFFTELSAYLSANFEGVTCSNIHEIFIKKRGRVGDKIKNDIVSEYLKKKKIKIFANSW